jgi:hypothetical protein
MMTVGQAQSPTVSLQAAISVAIICKVSKALASHSEMILNSIIRFNSLFKHFISIN